MQRKPRVALMTPIRSGMVHSEFAISLANTMRAIHGWDLAWFTVTGNSILPDARSLCLAQALAWDADKFVFIDDDISWTVQQLVFLIAHKVPICTGYYATRRVNDDDPTCITVKFRDDTRKTDENGLIEIDGAGFGFFRFDRKVIEAMREGCKPMFDAAMAPEINEHFRDWFPYEMNWSEGRQAYSRGGEDISFSRRAREKGFATYLDPALSVGHHAGAECFRANILEKPESPAKAA